MGNWLKSSKQDQWHVHSCIEHTHGSWSWAIYIVIYKRVENKKKKKRHEIEASIAATIIQVNYLPTHLLASGDELMNIYGLICRLHCLPFGILGCERPPPPVQEEQNMEAKKCRTEAKTIVFTDLLFAGNTLPLPPFSFGPRLWESGMGFFCSVISISIRLFFLWRTLISFPPWSLTL